MSTPTEHHGEFDNEVIARLTKREVAATRRSIKDWR
jgi:hypothetical protein